MTRPVRPLTAPPAVGTGLVVVGVRTQVGGKVREGVGGPVEVEESGVGDVVAVRRGPVSGVGPFRVLLRLLSTTHRPGTVP